MARYLLPRLIAFVTDTDPEDPEDARGLICAALTQYIVIMAASAAGENQDRVMAGMALVMPTLLARASAEGKQTYQETSGRLLELASADQSAFKAVLGGMSEGQKAFLEEVIRTGRDAADAGARAAGGGAGAGSAGAPTIELKLDFGEP